MRAYVIGPGGARSNHRIARKIKGKVLELFREQYEGTMPAMDSRKPYIKRYGIPQSVYRDKHSPYKSWAEPTIEEQLNDQKPMSQFEKSLAVLAIEDIHANSPQAKGREERLFKILQDRMVREMRLLEIKSVDEANEFLTTYLPNITGNSRSRLLLMPICTGPHCTAETWTAFFASERSAPSRTTLLSPITILSISIEQATRAKIVTVEERLDGTLHVPYNGQDPRFREITKKLTRDIADPPVLQQEKKPWIPPADHPWK